MVSDTRINNRIFTTKNKCLIFITFIVFVYLSTFITGYRYIGWDSRDLGLVNFTYFSDCLKNGIIPSWNPFILSGEKFFTLNSIFCANPITLIFVLLSYLVGVDLAFNYYIIFSIFLCEFGIWLLANQENTDFNIISWIVLSYIFLIFPRIFGQVAFCYSFAVLPWMILFIKDSTCYVNNLKKIFIQWTFISIIMQNGYVWINFVEFSGCFIYYCILMKKNGVSLKNALLNIFVMCCALILFYGLIILPGYIGVQENYKNIGKHFSSTEPRLRSVFTDSAIGLNDCSINKIENLLLYFISMFNPLDARQSDVVWTNGIGPVVFSLLLIGSNQKKWFAKHRILILLFLIILLYITGIIWPIIKYIPVLNGNRWLFIGNFFLIMVCLRICSSDLKSFKINKKIPYIQLLLVILILCYLFMKEMWKSIIMLVVSLILSACIFYTKKMRNAALLLSIIVLGVISFEGTINNYNYADKEEVKLIENRKLQPVYNGNDRIMYNTIQYTYDNKEWLIKKIPINQGYDNLSNPLYWYVKNDSFVKSIAFITGETKIYNDTIDRIESEEQAENIMSHINDSGIPVCVDNDSLITLRSDNNNYIQSVMVTPNKITINCNINSPSYLILNQQYDKHWHAYVDGKEKRIFKANLLFQGCELLSGNKKIEFKYFSLLSLLPYIQYIFFIFLFGYKICNIKNKKNEKFKHCEIGNL